MFISILYIMQHPKIWHYYAEYSNTRTNVILYLKRFAARHGLNMIQRLIVQQ